MASIGAEGGRGSDREQDLLRGFLRLEDEAQSDPATVRYVAGADVSFVKEDASMACASLVVLSFPELEVVCELTVPFHSDRPYLPSFLAFREAEPLAALVAQLRETQPHLVPQVWHAASGTAHPER